MAKREEEIGRYFRSLTSAGGHEGLESLGDGGSLEATVESYVAWKGDDAKRPSVKKALEKLREGKALDAEDANTFEAIILPGKRPVAVIRDDRIASLPSGEFSTLLQGATRARIEKTFRSIGCVLVPSDPRIPYGGTGFVVGKGLVMTNRHVARLFTEGVGTKRLAYSPGAAAFTPKREAPSASDSPSFEVRRVVMVHPYWDMALLEVPDLDAPALALATDTPSTMVAVVGYPAFDPRNNVDVQKQVFDGVFDVKRVAPGYATGRREVQSFENRVRALTHDASTLGGNSGSAVLDVNTGAVLALHFAGRYLESNYAVPMAELALDARVIDAGVAFGAAPSEPSPWDDRWIEVDGEESSASSKVVSTPHTISTRDDHTGEDSMAHNQFNFSGPVTIHVHGAGTSGPGEAPRVDAGGDDEAANKPRVKMQFDEDYDARPGYDPGFLGVDIDLPKVSEDRAEEMLTGLDGETLVLPYYHYSLAMNAERRLCMWTAANIDYSRAGRKHSMSRAEFGEDAWRYDPRVPEEYQISDREFYKPARKVDRGHIVRREDSAWGATKKETIYGNSDTFHWTNCTPQHERFNQSGKQGVWGLLENSIQNAAKGASEKMIVFAGPVLAKRDPRALGIKYPVKFWKVIVADTDEGLMTYAFVQDQSGVVKEYGLGIEESLDLGFEESQVTVSEIESLTGVVFADIVKQKDVLGAGESVRLTSAASVRTRRAKR